ncbi:PREDICTED: putative protein FAR1-RELATED SEQUENCE 10 [Priapulus caudatus]|uniref:SWIM-type domain-containing protein n=1 Tax=Priapulus caudatus TaxID=37621 RepID=A0ABM1F385_PRICU|nr:PREDICTED: putative protein FAR1-RELATED SEQUENCE 10 [Priapulus caudatus]
MRKDTSATIHVVTDSDNFLRGIFYQSVQMKKMFAAFPELILVDATYRLNNVRMPLYVMLIVDGNGQAEIVALWIVADEDAQTLRQMIRTFKSQNDNSNKIKCIMADKDMTERQVMINELPDAHLLICLFHTMRSFRREISTEKMGITQDQRIAVLEIVQKLVYSKDEEDYQRHYMSLLRCELAVVIEYYNKNWHELRGQWVEGLKNDHCHFMNRTNNRLEAINQKLKSVITKSSSIVIFWQDLMKCVNSLQIERKHRAIQLQTKVPVFKYANGSYQQRYQNHLTPFAFGHMSKQFELSERLTIIENEQGSYDATSATSKTVCYENTCQCSFFKAMCLPCRHIMACRKFLHVDWLCVCVRVFVPELCATRWTKEFYFAQYMFSETAVNMHFKTCHTSKL